MCSCMDVGDVECTHMNALVCVCVNVYNVTKIGDILYPIYGHKGCLQVELIVFLKTGLLICIIGCITNNIQSCVQHLEKEISPLIPVDTSNLLVKVSKSQIVILVL